MKTAGQLERYRELRPLGAGGMGEVTLAEDRVLGRRVALKRLRGTRDGRDGRDGELGRLRREALVGASFNHPNLVAVYDALFEDDDLVIVMEYVEGQTLSEALRGGTPLPPDRVAAIVTAVAAALDQVHRNNVVHRDVKPGNILLGIGGVVKLGDLGIAAVADRTRMTSTGAVLGTICYMSPEQLEGGPPTPAADIYALAAVAFEALSGRKARTESNPLALAHALATQPPPDLREAWPQASTDVAAVLSRGMAREPAERPRSAGELARRLAAALGPTAATASDPMAWHAPPRPQRQAVRRARPAVAGAPASPGRGRDAAGSRLALALAGAAGAIALVLIILLSMSQGGGGARSPSRPAAPPKTTHPAAPKPQAAAAAPATAAAGGANSPVGAVETFYALAAAHRYADAWALADPAFRSQLQGLRAFSRQQSAVRSIRFNSANVLSGAADAATVAVDTTPVLTSGQQHCHGTVDVVRSGSSWLLHQISIQCP